MWCHTAIMSWSVSLEASTSLWEAQRSDRFEEISYIHWILMMNFWCYENVVLPSAPCLETTWGYIYMYIYIYIYIYHGGFLAQPWRSKNTYIQLLFSLKCKWIKRISQHMIPYRSNWLLIQGLTTQVIITLHDTTELQHVHNPTTVLHTWSCHHTCLCMCCYHVW